MDGAFAKAGEIMILTYQELVMEIPFDVFFWNELFNMSGKTKFELSQNVRILSSPFDITI